MLWQHFILYSVIVLWGLPAARVRWGAMLILTGWAVTEAFAQFSLDSLPFRFEMLVAVIVIILALCVDWHWPSMLLFIPMGALFFIREKGWYHDYYIWHAGWALQIVQILFVGKWRYLPEAWSALNDVVRSGSISRALSRDHHRPFGDPDRSGSAGFQTAEASVHPADAEQR